MKDPLKVSYSGLQTYSQCPRKYRHLYLDRRVTIPKFDAMAVGSVVHEGLARLVSGAPLDLAQFAEKVTSEDACVIAAMLLAWPRRWEDFDVVGVEVPFDAPIKNPATDYAIRGIRYMGFVDALLKDRSTGELVVLEHKTTSDVITGFGPYWSRLAIDDQIALYRMVWNADRIIYNVGKKPKLRPAAIDAKNAGENPTQSQILDQYMGRVYNVLTSDKDEWFQWREIHKTPEEMADAAQGLYDRAKTLIDAYRSSRWPKHPGACRTIYGVCPYLDVCTGRASLDDDALFMCREER